MALGEDLFYFAVTVIVTVKCLSATMHHPISMLLILVMVHLQVLTLLPLAITRCTINLLIICLGPDLRFLLICMLGHTTLILCPTILPFYLLLLGHPLLLKLILIHLFRMVFPLHSLLILKVHML
ncbi:hypothetical protein Lalb_Chr18g0050531 [Lupinus albus]|uniref:Uncharacterized protein n=1 Tax=Lupinus albus TaxID=3870 RepID=A0A6A4NYC7_LUPAL|nr:hypothetical protein Lalb_Chr18g0050531 [Lupinus albus]